MKAKARVCGACRELLRENGYSVGGGSESEKEARRL